MMHRSRWKAANAGSFEGYGAPAAGGVKGSTWGMANRIRADEETILGGSKWKTKNTARVQRVLA